MDPATEIATLHVCGYTADKQILHAFPQITTTTLMYKKMK